MTEVTLAGILEQVSTLVTSALGWMGDVLAEIAGNPILLIFCVALPLVGTGIGFVRRLIG